MQPTRLSVTSSYSTGSPFRLAMALTACCLLRELRRMFTAVLMMFLGITEVDRRCSAGMDRLQVVCVFSQVEERDSHTLEVQLRHF